MIFIVSDASSIILLEKTRLLDKIINEFIMMIPKEIEMEAIIFGKERNYPDAFRIEEKIKKNLIKVKNVKNQKFVRKLMEDFNIGKGEAEAIALFKQESANLLATDDKLAIKACRSLLIPTSGTCAFVTQSFDNKIISKDEANDMIEILAKEGRYKGDIIFKALNHIKGGKNEK